MGNRCREGVGTTSVSKSLKLLRAVGTQHLNRVRRRRFRSQKVGQVGRSTRGLKTYIIATATRMRRLRSCVRA